MGVSLTYEAIVQAIGNFSAGKCMGNNGFGSTYKTEIALGSLVAVKRLTVGRFQGVTTVSCRGAVNWKIVHKIALDVAHALAYLHEQCTPKAFRYLLNPCNNGGSWHNWVWQKMCSRQGYGKQVRMTTLYNFCTWSSHGLSTRPIMWQVVRRLKRFQPSSR
ncbi:hypothetical protein GOBAR_DD03715 [Gossypium barbadense]|nr:hypothetical protein GOBAR_DD03715 [Gossypium barbadense]